MKFQLNGLAIETKKIILELSYIDVGRELKSIYTSHGPYSYHQLILGLNSWISIIVLKRVADCGSNLTDLAVYLGRNRKKND